MKLPEGADAKLGEHLAQVVPNGAGADEQADTNLRVRQTLSGQPRDLGLLGSQRLASRAGRRAAGWAVRLRLSRPIEDTSLTVGEDSRDEPPQLGIEV
jgi:hypothetical protein